MPIFPFKTKSSKKSSINGIVATTSVPASASSSSSSVVPKTTSSASPSSASASSRASSSRKSSASKQPAQTKLVFHCQLAHGSPTGLVSGFGSVKELYQQIADCFNIPASTILFCTLNTHKIDMTKLLGGHVDFEDFIFAHVKGQKKEVQVLKSEATLGLTITDNGAGHSFVKRIVKSSVIDRMKSVVKIGDHIEKINGISMLGVRHFEVAKALKNIPVGSVFTLRLIEVNSPGFQMEPATRGRKSTEAKSGTQTLRFKTNGEAVVEEVDNKMLKAIARISDMMEAYMGVHDAELARQIWDLAVNKRNPSDFVVAVNESELSVFEFTDDFIFDLWAAIDDVKMDRIVEEDEDEHNERM